MQGFLLNMNTKIDYNQEPDTGCNYCQRLVEFRKANQENNPDWHNQPVRSFGSLNAQLLVVGLAPGLRGANRTGRPFTGDYAGDLLYATMIKFGFAKGEYLAKYNDPLKLINARITNAVRCVPPQNKPIGEEIDSCGKFLKIEIKSMQKLSVILCLGSISHTATLRALGLKLSKYKFQHGEIFRLNSDLSLIDSYHCSRLNTNTKRLTPSMFEAIFKNIKKRIH
tara:strand:+ start:511 stop:1182 length:672 start_codon:yes stop_codon:yes gene_type:complete